MMGYATSTRPFVRYLRMVSAVLLAWIGMVVHNLADLPIAFLSPENVGPGVVSLVLLMLWLFRPSVRWTAALLLVWGSINVAGAILTVLPLPFLPFVPEQTLYHYAFHVLYLFTQMPLLLAALHDLRRGESGVGWDTRSPFAPRRHRLGDQGAGAYDRR